MLLFAQKVLKITSSIFQLRDDLCEIWQPQSIRLQAQTGSNTPEPPKLQTKLHCFKETFNKEGLLLSP